MTGVQTCALPISYHATAFDPAPDVVVDMVTDYSTDVQLTSGEPFAYKRTGLSTAVTGSGSEGFLIKVNGGANNFVDHMDCHIGASL